MKNALHRRVNKIMPIILKAEKAKNIKHGPFPPDPLHRAWRAGVLRLVLPVICAVFTLSLTGVTGCTNGHFDAGTFFGLKSTAPDPATVVQLQKRATTARQWYNASLAGINLAADLGVISPELAPKIEAGRAVIESVLNRLDRAAAAGNVATFQDIEEDLRDALAAWQRINPHNSPATPAPAPGAVLPPVNPL